MYAANGSGSVSRILIAITRESSFNGKLLSIYCVDSHARETQGSDDDESGDARILTKGNVSFTQSSHTCTITKRR